MLRDRARAGVIAGVAAAALALVGCPEEKRRTAGGGQELTPGQVLGIARAINMGEVDQATAVQGRVTDPNVSAFVERMIQDHRASLQQLEQVTVQMGLVPEESDLSRELTQDVQDTTGELAQKQGPELAKDYIDGQVDTHQKALSTIDDELMPATTDPALQQYLTDLRGVVASHLELAKQMKESGAGEQGGYQQGQQGYQEPAGVGR